MTETDKSDFPSWVKKGALLTLGAGMLAYALSGDFACSRQNTVTYHPFPPHYKHLERRIEAVEKAQGEDGWGLVGYSLLGAGALALFAGCKLYEKKVLDKKIEAAVLANMRQANRINPTRDLEGAIIVPGESI